MQASIERGFELSGERSSLRVLIRDLIQSRALLLMLARKDFFVRFRRASFGMLWAIGLPFVQAVVLAVVFSRIVRFETDIPFPAFVYSGILPWSFLSSSVNGGTTSIVEGSNLATKIYFPRAVLPLVGVFASVYGFVPSLVILIAMALIVGVRPGFELLMLFPATLILMMLSASFALVLSALQVYFRDVKHLVAAITLPWFWASGVFYPLSRVGGLRRWIEINPAVGMIQLFRAALGGAADDWERGLWWTFGWIVVLLIAAALLHRRYDRVFVDRL